jgi:hypothetical protein
VLSDGVTIVYTDPGGLCRLPMARIGPEREAGRCGDGEADAGAWVSSFPWTSLAMTSSCLRPALTGR